MTQEFKETLDRLEQAWNYPDGSYLLITQCGDEKCWVRTVGDVFKIVNGVIKSLKSQILPYIDDEDVRDICDELKKVIADDEKRRFQKTEEEQV